MDYKQRVIEEHAELEQRCSSLYMFLAGKQFLEIPEPEQRLLRQQYYAMKVYSGILEQRIEGFEIST